MSKLDKQIASAQGRWQLTETKRGQVYGELQQAGLSKGRADGEFRIQI